MYPTLPEHLLELDYSDILSTPRGDLWPGLKSGGLTIESVSPDPSGAGKIYSCRCQCGVSVLVTTAELRANRSGCDKCNLYGYINLGTALSSNKFYLAAKNKLIIKDCAIEAHGRVGYLAPLDPAQSKKRLRDRIDAEHLSLVAQRQQFTDHIQLGAFCGAQLYTSSELHRRGHEEGGLEIPYAPLSAHWEDAKVNAGKHSTNVLLRFQGSLITLAELVRSKFPGGDDPKKFRRVYDTQRKALSREKDAAEAVTPGSWTVWRAGEFVEGKLQEALAKAASGPDKAPDKP